ncbi:MAG: SDR family NAD(P)-dependent oxidoreductase [Calditrichaceae bacterium]|jgi:NAD(P)-dependent dehydrogenase (short-subunit alcohol dehydrogenase family)
MARIFITGSSDGLGQLAAKSLAEKGHRVVLHGRNEQRGRDARENVPGAEDVLTGDLSDIEETTQLADQVNALGSFDAVIHNAGINRGPGEKIFKVNTLAPYILTCLIQKPKRLIYLTSGMHMQGHAELDSFKGGTSGITYSDSKLHDMMLCKTVARRWPEVYANAVNPGWVPTKMGGRGAPDDLQKGYETQVWLAVSDDEEARVTGRYFFHQKTKDCNPEAEDVQLQDQFIALCKEITGIALP